MKKFSKIFALLFVASLALVGVVGCKEKTTKAPETTVRPTPVNPIPESLRNAVAYIKGLYTVSEEEQVVTGDLERINKVNDVNIQWTVNVEETKVTVSPVSGKDLVKVAIVDKENGVSFQLSAKCVKGSDEFTLVYKYKFPPVESLTYAQYAAKNKGDLVKVKGVVVGMVGETTGSANKCLYVEAVENNAIVGAYYVYGASVDPTKDENLAIGKTVEVLGTKDEYSGTDEITKATYKVLDDAAVTLEPVDLTAAFTAAADLKDATITGKQHLLVTIKGVTIEPADDTTASSGYYKFSLGNKTSYVRISGSTCAIASNKQKTFKDNFANWEFYKADVTGVVQVFNGSFYLYPVNENAFSNAAEQTLTDAQKVAVAKKKVVDAVQNTYYGNNTVTLPTSSTIAAISGTTISWALKAANDHVTVAENVMTITAHADLTTFTLVATVTSGEVHEDFEVVVNMVQDSVIKTVSQFLTAKDKENVQYVRGIVGAIKGTATKAGSFVLVGADGVSIFSYNSLLVKVGDEVIVSAKFAVNYDFPQLGSIELIKTVATAQTVPGTVTKTITKADVDAIASDADNIAAYSGKLFKMIGFFKETTDATKWELYEDSALTKKLATVYAGTELGFANGTKYEITCYCRGLNTKSITVQAASKAEIAAPKTVAPKDVVVSETQEYILKNVEIADNKVAKSETVNIIFYTDQACETAAALAGKYTEIKGLALKGTDSTISFYVTSATKVEVVASQKAATITFDADRTGTITYVNPEGKQDSDKAATKMTWVQNGITFVVDKEDSSSPCNNNNGQTYTNPIRVYKGQKATINYENMVKLVFVCKDASYATTLVNSTFADGVFVEANGANVTVYFASANAFSVLMSSAQVQIKSIEVYTPTAA
ncbi:MAG: hypothetical protein K6F59_02970 [Gammaproteobacteria bacterium]|nr:hypothetical protein [Gammaproteobacteria bacterium]